MSKIQIDFIRALTKTVADGTKVRRGEIVEYTDGSYNGHAIIMGWSESGKTLELLKASVRWREDRVYSVKLYDGQHSTFTARYDLKTGKFKSNKFHGNTLIFLPKPPLSENLQIYRQALGLGSAKTPDQPEELGPLAEHRKEQAEILAMALRTSAHPLK